MRHTVKGNEMSKLLVCISGTGQDTSSAKKDARDNPLKIAVRCGWKGYGASCLIQGQHVIYVPGIGTGENQKIIDEDKGWDTWFEARHNGRWAPPRMIAQRQNYMREQLTKAYEPEDEICIVGFSRGAAEARIFASALSKDNIPVHLLCCFDTVAQIGGPDTSKWPDDKVLFENNAVAGSVRDAIHLVSIDENRKLFPPTLMDHDDRVDEVWFSGVHSDVGGGYAEHKLSDVPLGYMVERMRRALFKVEDPERIEDADRPRGIAKKDIAFAPNPLAKMHHHRGKGPRKICVIDSGRPSKIEPMIHKSVRARMEADRSYSIGTEFDWRFVE
jgi:uncharacterized protein (DUF2235 family)